MRRTIKGVILSILVAMLLLCSCNGIDISEETVGKPLLTPEELYELSGLTAEDFTDIDVYEFIEENELTRDNADWASSIYKAYFAEETEAIKSYYDDYQYLFDSPLKKLEEGMADQIKTLYVHYTFKAGFMYYGGKSILYDFTKDRIFYDQFNEYGEGITEQKREELKELIKESGIEKLKADKKGLGFNKEGYEIILETEDGRIAHLKGENTMPEEVKNFCEGVFN